MTTRFTDRDEAGPYFRQWPRSVAVDAAGGGSTAGWSGGLRVGVLLESCSERSNAAR